MDVIAELRRPKQSQGGGETRRVLSAVGRAPGIPSEWVVELKDGSFVYEPPERRATPTEMEDEREEERRCELREAILFILAREEDLTEDEIRDRLTGGLQKNSLRLQSILRAEDGNLWSRHRAKGNLPFLHRLMTRMVPNTGEKGQSR